MTERETLSATKFGKCLAERFKRDRDNRGAFYCGLGLVGDGFDPSSRRAEEADAA